MKPMTKKQIQQKRRYLKRKQLLDQLLYENSESSKPNTFEPIDNPHKLIRFHKSSDVFFLNAEKLLTFFPRDNPFLKSIIHLIGEI